MSRPRLVLASASTARLSLLRDAGVEPVVIVSGASEEDVGPVSPPTYAAILARRKAVAVTAVVEPRHDLTDAVVLGCDSILEFEGEVQGKPLTTETARRRWRAMRGKQGTLHTGHCLIQPTTGRTIEAVGSTTVWFASDLTDAEIDAYVDSGEPLKVAGAFKIEGLGGTFIERIDGDHHNVCGLSTPLLRRMLAKLDITWTDLWPAVPVPDSVPTDA